MFNLTYTRFQSIPSVFRPNMTESYTLPSVDTESLRIVDDSSYVPNKQALKILQKKLAEGMLNQNLAYDNPKDLSSGAVNIYARQKGRDLAELTQQMRTLEKEAQSAVKDALQKQAKQKQQFAKPAKPEVQAPAPASGSAPTT